MEHKLLNIIGICAVAITLALAGFIHKENSMTIGLDIKNMDTRIAPGTDFYDYATRGWRVAHPIPNDYARYGTFELLAEQNDKRVREIAETDTGKVGKLFRIAMNERQLNTETVRPVRPYLADISEITSVADLPSALGKLHSFVDGFFADTVELDEKDSSYYLYHIVQSGTGLSRDYYFDDDEKSEQVREKYIEYLDKLMTAFGVSGDAQKIFNLEKQLAKAFYRKEDLRNPLKNYHKMSIQEFKDTFVGFDWDKYFAAREINPKSISVAQPEALTEAINIINNTDIDLLKTYLKVRMISGATPYLDDRIYDIAFEFNKVLTGQSDKKPRWKRAIGIVDGSLGDLVGKIFTERFFHADAKSRMQDLVKNLQSALKMRIENLDWMSADTKQEALKKLSTFHAKIGYPDVWRDYSNLEISNNDSLYDNMVRIWKFHDRFWLDKIDKPRDPNIWYMNAHEVNAYYDPSTNEICFPAGILQYPFFDMRADDAFNYGAIGSIIGHEMTHGFDDNGRHFDADGNMRDWWNADDAREFNKRTNVLREFFNNITVATDTRANGTFTLGENLADYGGVTVSFTAFTQFGNRTEPINGLTDAQRFFIAYAMGFTQNIRDAEVLRLTKTDEHSLGRWRVNGILPHIDAWYDAFKINDKSKMYIAPNKRVKIW